MREALISIASVFTECAGLSKIAVLFIVSIIAMVLIDENTDENAKRRRINPTVFLLSLWSGIAYAIIRVLNISADEQRESQSSSKVPYSTVPVLLFSFVSIALCGEFVISERAYKASVYYYTNNTITVLAALCIITYFVIYYLISTKLFENRKERVLFIIILMIIHLFDFYSENTAGISLMLSPVTVGSIILHDVMPIMLWIYLMYEDKIKEKFASEDTGYIEDGEDIEEEWDMKKHKILNMRNMSIFVALIVVAFVAAVYVLNNKINSLYDATVVLEKAANSKMSVYEMNASDGSVALSVMVSPNGTVTVVENGGADGDASLEFIKEYTENVDIWYLCGEEEDSKSAYDYCIDHGIKVNEAFVVSGIEKID